MHNTHKTLRSNKVKNTLDYISTWQDWFRKHSKIQRCFDETSARKGQHREDRRHAVGLWRMWRSGSNMPGMFSRACWRRIPRCARKPLRHGGCWCSLRPWRPRSAGSLVLTKSTSRGWWRYVEVGECFIVHVIVFIQEHSKIWIVWRPELKVHRLFMPTVEFQLEDSVDKMQCS